MIHVLIERHIAEGMLSTYEKHCRMALQRTMVAHGFISGEAFSDTHNSNHRFLLCKWRSQQDWNRWFNSDDRRELMNLINPILTEPEKVLILEN